MIVDNDSALEGVLLDRDEFYNFRFKLPNGNYQKASMQEAMLWLILQKLQEPIAI